MKQKRSVAGMAVTAGLALAMVQGMAAPAVVAFAAPTYGKGSIQITKVPDSDYTQTFIGYQIFRANVSDDSSQGNTTGKTEKNIAWFNDSVKAKVEAAIKSIDTNYAGTTAQDAADWIVANVQNTTAGTHVEGTSAAYKIAEAVKEAETNTQHVEAGKATEIDEGYWVFVKDPSSTMAEDETGTAPIFAVVGGGDVSVTEKISNDTIPTPGKIIKNKDAATGDNDHGASVAVGDVTTFELSATLPENIADYKTYKLVFTDTLSEGLTYKANLRDAKLVRADGTTADISLPAVSGDGQTHAFTYEDIKALLPSGYTYAKGDKIVFDYDAEVNDKAAAGQDNASNKVVLQFSNNPTSSDMGTTADQPTTHEYTYNLVLNKVDLGTERALDGAQFTIQNAAGKYIDATGARRDDETWLEAKDGALTVAKLDAGTYTIHEIQAPEGYDAAADITITIEPTFNEDGTLQKLGNTLTSRDDVIAGTIDPGSAKSDNVLQAKDGTASDAKAGTVTVTIGDRKGVRMPLTGMKGTTALLVYGSAILVVSAAAYLRHKKSQSEDNA